MTTETLDRHIGFLDQLDAALHSALEYYSGADGGNVEELRQLQLEVHRARRTVLNVNENLETSVPAQRAEKTRNVAASSI